MQLAFMMIFYFKYLQLLPVVHSFFSVFLFPLPSVFSFILKMTLNATGCAWEQKQNRNHKIMKSDLTFESIISCWESRKCCVVRHFLSEYIVLTCSSHYQPTQPSYLHPRTLPHRAPGLAATSQAKSKRGNEAISLRFPLPITCLVSKYWIILHGSWRCDLFIHLLLIQFSTGMGTEVVFIFLQSSWALPGLQNEEITRHQVNKLFHPLQERFTLVSVHSAVTMPPPSPSPTWASVVGCVSLLSLSSLLCISLGNDFGDASSPLTATLAS